MKKSLIFAAVLIVMTAACRTESRTDVDVEREDGVAVTETETTTVPTVDTSATADVTAGAAEAARETGTALEEAGREIQEETTRTDNP